jgi:hypothetical protein
MQKLSVILLALFAFAQAPDRERLERHRNLGKAFFENPTTQEQAVAEFRAALALAPSSAREHANLGMSLLAAGKTEEGIAELERAQKLDPKLPHTWFNLGVQYKKAGEYPRALRQFEQMAKLVPDEPVTRYNLGVLYKLEGRIDDARRAFELSSTLAPHLAAPHFQLYNLFRQQEKMDEAKRRLALFQEAKKAAESTPVPEDMEWSFYSEVIDDVHPAAPSLPAVLTEALGDFDNDGRQDKLSLVNGRPVLLRSGRTRVPLPAVSGSFRHAVWIDYDHDYDLDLVLLGPRSVLLRNKGAAGFEDVTASFPFVDGVAVSGVAFRYIPDTRAMDLLVHYEGRPPVLYRDRLGGKYEPTPAPDLPVGGPQKRGGNWVTVELQGVKNLKLAEGAEVEIKSGILYEKQIYRGSPLRFELGPVGELDVVRITWPNGLIQSEPRQPVNRALVFKEAQRLSGSCPQIFIWNGREFEYVTDILGVAPLGASSGDGEYFPVDHEEAVVLPRLVPRDGRYQIRLTEELAEVAYIDGVRLLAVDHTPGHRLHVNERFQAPPYPPLKLQFTSGRIEPNYARDGEYRFPRAASLLVLTGWIDWADGSTFLNAAQQGRPLTLPKLEAFLDGRWQTVEAEMGIPAGKPKTIVVPLPRPASRFRITTNLAIHWQDVFLADETHPEYRITELRPEAELRFRGFSRAEIDPARRKPEMFFYENPLPVSMWNPTPGLYTRYGNVNPLLREGDGKLIIMGSGDELAMDFPVPPVAHGKERSFVLVVDGWAKDQDPNTAHSQTVEPLPFQGMSAYPYPAGEAFPDTPELRAWRKEYNTRPALRLLRPLSRLTR